MSKSKIINIFAIALFLGLAFLVQFSSLNVTDPDSFYHIRHAWLYRATGLFGANFPWTYHSVIKTLASDLWYGFHILLIPFTYLKDLVLGIKIAGALLTTAALFACFKVMTRLKVKLPLLWPFILFFSAPNIMFRLLMTRPHIISFSLSLLLFSFLLSGSAWIIFLISFGITWVHLSLFWVAILITKVVMGVKFFSEKKIEWLKLAAVFGGIIAGWLLRPNPLGAAKLVYIQVVKLIFEKQGGLPLLFGTELFPLSYTILFQNFGAFLLLWLGGAILFFWLWRKNHLSRWPGPAAIAAWSSFIISTVFFLLTILVARRAHDLWVGYGLIFIALMFSYLQIISLSNQSNKILKYIGTVLIITALTFMVFYTPYKNSASLENRAVKPEQFKEIALWLKTNSRPGEIVFNTHWSDFPMLFFWNQQNYYIGGMDPIFQYVYNPTLYWKFHFLSTDQVTKKTCGAMACTAETLEDTYTVLTRDFQAKYIVLEKLPNPAVYSFLNNDPKFEKKLETKTAALYLIK